MVRIRPRDLDDNEGLTDYLHSQDTHKGPFPKVFDWKQSLGGQSLVLRVLSRT